MEYKYVYGFNKGATMEISLFNNKDEFIMAFKKAKKLLPLTTIYSGKIIDGIIVWDKLTFPKK